MHPGRGSRIMPTMSTPRFYIEQLDSPTVDLPEAEARHARQSRRLSAGDIVMLFDGQGRQAVGRITATAGRAVIVAIDQVVQTPRPRPALTIAFAVPKGPRQDTLIEKCTELGAAVLQPMATARSVADASPHRIDKWHRTAVEAAKQSGQAWLPELREIRSFQEVLGDKEADDIALLAVSEGNITVGNATAEQMKAGHTCPTGFVEPRPITDLLEALRNAPRVLALIGPEGGWTQQEIAEALAAGARPVSIGPNILRIETAAVAIVAIVHAILVA